MDLISGYYPEIKDSITLRVNIIDTNNVIVFDVFVINESLTVDVATAVSNSSKNFDSWVIITRKMAIDPEFFRIANLVIINKSYEYEFDMAHNYDYKGSDNLLTAKTDRPLSDDDGKVPDKMEGSMLILLTKLTTKVMKLIHHQLHLVCLLRDTFH